MKRFEPTLLALILTMVVSSTALGGNIAGGRAAGNIPGGRAAGNIAGGRASGNIAGGRSTAIESPSIINPPLSNETSRFNFQSSIPGTFVGLIRMLLESGAMF
jgi:hypothetical protein